MNVIHTKDCPVCGSDNFSDLVKCNDFLVSREVFSIQKCNKCEFAFTQDFPDEKEIGRYYDAPEYISHTDSDKGLINSLYHLARKIALQSKVKLVLKYAPAKTGTLLDIGCGTGYFLNAVKDKKWLVTGIEKSDTTREYAHKKFDLNVQDADYLNEIRPKTKDIITLWHVLEHLEHLNDTMNILNNILKDDGTLLIALPNKESSDAKFYNEFWAAYDVPRHLWHFSPSDFDKLASKHGFKIIEKKNMPFDPFYISMLSEKIKGTPLASLVGLTRGCFFFLQGFFNTDRNSSIIYILKKEKSL